MAKSKGDPRAKAAARIKENVDVDMPDDIDMPEDMPDEMPMDEGMDVDMDMPELGGLSPEDVDALTSIATGRGKSAEEAAEIVEIVEEFMTGMVGEMGGVEELPAPAMEEPLEEII